jgi:long-chain fatty acid transport protein
MKKSPLCASFLLLCSVLIATDVGAAGFALPDQDAAAMGMGGAFAAQADNPSAVWYNPAGITQLDGTRVSAGVIAIFPVLTHENLNGTTDVSDRQLYLPVQFFGTSKLNDNIFLGLGITSPFGLSTDWSVTSATAGVATFSRIKTLDVNPNIAFRLSDRFSVAVGLDYMKLWATLENLIAPGVSFRLDGDGSGWGANAGLKWKAADRLNVGLTYRSRVKIRVDTAMAEVPAAGLSSPVTTEIVLPDLIQAGISYKATDNFSLNADLDYTWWSTYDRLVLQSPTIFVLSGGLTDTSVDEKQWKNTWSFRVGVQERLSGQWKVRAGYVYDQTPVPEPHFETRAPDSDRQGLTIGAGYQSGPVTVDASYMYLMFKSRTITDSLADGTTQVLNGTYKSQAHLFGLTLAYKF